MEDSENMSQLRRFHPLVKSAIEEASRKAFGQLPVDPARSGNRLLKNKPLGPLVTNHYHDPKVTDGFFKFLSPSFRTEEDDRRTSKLLRLRRRGKSAPKKGQGKRTTKK